MARNTQLCKLFGVSVIGLSNFCFIALTHPAIFPSPHLVLFFCLSIHGSFYLGSLMVLFPTSLMRRGTFNSTFDFSLVPH